MEAESSMLKSVFWQHLTRQIHCARGSLVVGRDYEVQARTARSLRTKANHGHSTVRRVSRQSRFHEQAGSHGWCQHSSIIVQSLYIFGYRVTTAELPFLRLRPGHEQELGPTSQLLFERWERAPWHWTPASGVRVVRSNRLSDAVRPWTVFRTKEDELILLASLPLSGADSNGLLTVFSIVPISFQQRQR
eukprot:scaffold1499_cov105-Cylindrotheca_fusiformis.AAC.1